MSENLSIVYFPKVRDRTQALSLKTRYYFILDNLSLCVCNIKSSPKDMRKISAIFQCLFTGHDVCIPVCRDT